MVRTCALPGLVTRWKVASHASSEIFRKVSASRDCPSLCRDGREADFDVTSSRDLRRWRSCTLARPRDTRLYSRFRLLGERHLYRACFRRPTADRATQETNLRQQGHRGYCLDRRWEVPGFLISSHGKARIVEDRCRG